MDGTGGAQATPSWAKLAWEHGCQNGDGASCRELGGLHERGIEVAASVPTALQLYQRGCQLGSMASCHEVARFQRLGIKTVPNVGEANRLDLWACNYSNADACLTMSQAYATGQGVAPSEAESRRLHARACELGNQTACSTQPPAVAPVLAPPPPGAPAQPPGMVPPPPGGVAAPPGQPAARPGLPPLPPAAIDAAIQSAIPRLQRCYERRARRVQIRGTVVVSWRVDARGRIQDAAVQPTSSVTDEWMQRCVRDAVRNMRFQAPGLDTAPVSRAFTF
jgi:TonB family protein